MTDNDVIRVFLPIIKSGLTLDGFTDVIVKQNWQPTLQGAETNPTVYFQKIANKRYGYAGRLDTWNSLTSSNVHVEEQWIEATYQVTALVLQDVHNTNKYTASDLVNEVAAILQSDNTINTLMQNGIGVLRITELTNQFFTDDRDQYEASPTFDFVLTYKQSRVSTQPVIDSFDYVINGV